MRILLPRMHFLLLLLSLVVAVVVVLAVVVVAVVLVVLVAGILMVQVAVVVMKSWPGLISALWGPGPVNGLFLARVILVFAFQEFFASAD